MIAHDLGDQRQAQARAARLGGDEGFEDVRHQVGAERRSPLSRTVTSSGSDTRSPAVAAAEVARQADSWWSR